MAAETITDANFADFLARKPAVLALLKPDCIACRRFEPTFDSLTQDLQNVRLGKATVDLNSPIVKYFDRCLRLDDKCIEWFPTIIVLKDGKFGYLFQGNYGYADTIQIISDALSAENSSFVRIFRFDLLA